jgi:hypothetical protein
MTRRRKPCPPTVAESCCTLATPPSLPFHVSTAASIPASATLDDLIRVEQVSEATFYVGDLFRRQFGSEPPNYPRHFVALYKAARNAFVTIGFLHCSVVGDLCLCGGLVEDERAIGRMPGPHQAALRASGGVAAWLFRGAFARLADLPAFWAYVGDARIRDIFVAAGFVPLAAPHLLVRWNAALPADAREALIARVVAMGPF